MGSSPIKEPTTPQSFVSGARVGGKEELRANLLKPYLLRLRSVKDDARSARADDAGRNPAQRHRRRDGLDLGSGRAARPRRHRRSARCGRAHAPRQLAHAPREPRHLRAHAADGEQTDRRLSLHRAKPRTSEPHRFLRHGRGLAPLGAHDLPSARRGRGSAAASTVLRRARRRAHGAASLLGLDRCDRAAPDVSRQRRFEPARTW